MHHQNSALGTVGHTHYEHLGNSLAQKQQAVVYRGAGEVVLLLHIIMVCAKSWNHLIHSCCQWQPDWALILFS